MESDFTPSGPPLPPADGPLSPLARQVLDFGWRLPWISQPLALLEALFMFCADSLGAPRCHLVFDEEEGKGVLVRNHPESTALPVSLGGLPGGFAGWLQLAGGDILDFSAGPGPLAPAGVNPSAPVAAREVGGLVFPLRVEDRVAGVLVLAGGSFTTGEKAWLAFLARQASQVLGRMQMRVDLEFLGHVSRGLAHDLQGALTPVGTYLQLAALGDSGARKAGAMLPTATVGFEKTQSILRQAIALSRDEPLEFSTVSLGGAAREAFAALHARATEARVELVLDCPAAVRVRAEPVLLLRLLLNLLSNAITASPPYRQVRVEIRPGPEGRGITRIVDQGEGISATDLQRAGHAELREQDCGPSGQVPGLGIATSWRLARRLGGRLVFDGRPGRGTTVTFDLPPS